MASRDGSGSVGGVPNPNGSYPGQPHKLHRYQLGSFCPRRVHEVRVVRAGPAPARRPHSTCPLPLPVGRGRPVADQGRAGRDLHGDSPPHPEPLRGVSNENGRKWWWSMPPSSTPATRVRSGSACWRHTATPRERERGPREGGGAAGHHRSPVRLNRADRFDDHLRAAADHLHQPTTQPVPQRLLNHPVISPQSRVDFHDTSQFVV